MHVPEGWERTTLENYITVKHGFAFKSDFFTNEGQYVLMTPGSFFESGGFRNQGVKTKYYVGEFPSGYLLKKDDLVIAMTEQAEGLLGSAALIPENNKYLHNQRLGLVNVIEKERISIKFLYCLYNSRYVRKQISEQSAGTKVKHTSPDKLIGVTALIPPISEQQKIAQILSTWDKAIEKLGALIAAKQKRKKALMQQLLTGKKRFAGFEELWTEVELGTLFKEVKEKVGSENIFPHSITAGTGFVSHEEKWGKDISGSQYENYTLLKRGQFSYNKGNSKKYACGCMYLLKHADEIAVPNVFISFKRRKDNVCNEFYEQYFIADYCARELRRYITSGARSDGLLNLSKTDFFSVKLPSLPFKEQQKIASVLSAADNEIETQQKQLSALKQQKKALMQQLLTGKKRVQVNRVAA